jgi:hypothetical protein
VTEQSSYQTLGTITGGELHVHDRAGFAQAIARFAEGVVTVTIESSTEQAFRSTQANRFMWRVFTLIAEDTGHTKEDIHDWMCAMFLSHTIEVVDPVTGEVQSLPVTRGTSKLSPAAHAEFLDRVILWSGEFLSLEIPPRESG